jgi:SAM-dependent methyltransferase
MAQQHWDAVYRAKPPNEMSWHRPHLDTSLELISSLHLPADSPIIDVGAGASTLGADLVELGYDDVTLVDISGEALRSAQGNNVKCIEADITAISTLPSQHYAVWHDRAVFHFLTDELARSAYKQRLCAALRPGGFAILATFGLEGPSRCSNLDVVRYSPASLAAELGPRFSLRCSRVERHMTPWASEQQFVYCAFLYLG